jgi:hypothetical protein
MTEDEISKLLRLKRFEKPSPEYFENFLREFQERQRAQLLREPAWRIAWDRLAAFFGGNEASRYGYGLASAAVLVAAAIASFNILQSGPRGGEAVVARQEEASPAMQPAAFGLNSRVQLPDPTALARRMAHSAGAAFTMQPRYVMDTRPVSYEPPSSF